jgi:uncharacterized protein (TIGR02679 family)
VAELPAWVRDAAANPALAPLWDEFHRRASRDGRAEAVKAVTLTGLTPAQATAVAELLRLPREPEGRLAVPLAKVAAAWRTDAHGLAALLEDLRGPPGNRAADRDADRDRRAGAADRLARQAADLGFGTTVQAWASGQARATDRDDTVGRVLGLVAASDPARPVAIPVAAARQLGDAHALDPSAPAGRLLTGLLAAHAGLDDPAVSSPERRRMLRAVGLADDDVSSTVAVWRLPLAAAHPAAELVATCTVAGQPVALTLGQLRAWPPELAVRRVLVVENPAVLSAAAERAHPDPVVCTSGVPNSAVHELLDALGRHGGHLDVHADYDEVGLRIVEDLRASAGASPWQMDAAAYEAAAELSRVALPDDAVLASPWDPALADAMRARGRVAYEEHVIDRVLAPPGRP